MLEKKINQWNKMLRKMGMIFCAGVLAWNFNGKIDVQAASQNILEQRVLQHTKEKLFRTYYADYDGDGKKEAFIVTKKNQTEQTLWFSGEKQVKKLAVSDFSLKQGKICNISRKQKLFVVEGWGGGSGSWSYCLYVSQGKCHPVKNSGEGLTHISGKDFMVFPSAFDACKTGTIMTGHTWKAYYLKWTGKKFVNYTGTLISSRSLKKYEGAEKYLKEIKKAGYKIGKIYSRKNGIVNINLYKKDKYSVSYENVTLEKKGKKLSLRVHEKNGENIVKKSSYGGRYDSKTALLSPGYL